MSPSFPKWKTGSHLSLPLLKTPASLLRATLSHGIQETPAEGGHPLGAGQAGAPCLARGRQILLSRGEAWTCQGRGSLGEAPLAQQSPKHSDLLSCFLCQEFLSGRIKGNSSRPGRAGLLAAALRAGPGKRLHCY